MRCVDESLTNDMVVRSDASSTSWTKSVASEGRREGEGGEFRGKARLSSFDSTQHDAPHSSLSTLKDHPSNRKRIKLVV